MAIFDFPRVHFAGNIDIDVPTINNTAYFPLTMYDQMRSKPFLPPRLYFSNSQLIINVNPGSVPPIQNDAYNGYVYIEILTVNTIEILRNWCMNPLGTLDVDQQFVPYYQAAEKDLGANGFPLIGKAPGYWNMWGSMGIQMSSVNVTGVQTFDGTLVNTYTPGSVNPPSDVVPFLKASFDLNPQPATGVSTACIVETISAQSSFANMFCSNVNLYNTSNPQEIFMQGNPRRFAASVYSNWRVLAWMPPMAGSARFTGTILFDESPGTEQSQLVQFFKDHSSYDGRILKGIIISFQTLEIYENRYNQNFYIENNFQPVHNPAHATTIGTIAPWYEGDMETAISGRNLLSLNQNKWYFNAGGQGIPVACTPPVASLRDLGNSKALFSIDMGNSWPENMNPAFSVNNPPTKRGQVSFETMEMGMISIRYANTVGSQFASIDISPGANPLSAVKQRGCIFDWVLSDAAQIQNIKNNYLQVYQMFYGSNPDHVKFINAVNKYTLSNTDASNNSVFESRILKESDYMILSDQKGIYTNEGDTGAIGFYASSGNRVPCRLRIFQRGVPVTTPIKIYMGYYTAPEAGNDPNLAFNPGTGNTVPMLMKDNDIVQIDLGGDTPLGIKHNAIYYFVYEGQYPANSLPPFVVNNNYTIMDTGAFVVLRVHPKKDYSQYTDKSRPDYTAPTYEVVYEEIFKLYDVVYPVMASVIPFTKANWNNGTAAGMVLQRTQMNLWSSILYMPRSRELSASQLELLQAWAETFN
jgi:hypothetical protein